MAIKIQRLTVGSLETNCYLLIDGGQLIIIDPGAEPEKIIQEIEKTGAQPIYIINTHYHFDHTTANRQLKEKTGAPILIHQAEKDYVNFPVDPVRSRASKMSANPPSADWTSNGVDRFLKQGDEIKIGESVLRVIHTPGHTAGSICLLGEDFILTGDTLFIDGPGRTDLPGGSLADQRLSLQKLSKLIKPEMTVYPGHGQIFKGQDY